MWKDYKKEKPEEGVEVIAYNEKWINLDFNPRGTRVGFYNDGDFISAYWWDYQDDYIAISKEKCEVSPDFFESHSDSTEPQYWMQIPDFKK